MPRTDRSHTSVVGLADPGSVAPGTTRAGHDDRQQVVELLQRHYVAGRLDATELETRVEQALAATSLGDLDRLLVDLPPEAAAPRHATASHQESRPNGHTAWSGHCGWPIGSQAGGERSFRAHAISYIGVMALLVAIWLLTNPGGYFWPIWPMLGWGIGLASHGLSARTTSLPSSR